MANFRIIRDIEGLKTLKPKWEALFSNNSALRFSQSFAWNFGLWYRYFSTARPECSLYVVDGWQDGHLEQQMILPFMLDGNRVLRFIGDDYADVMGEIVPVHSENWHAFYRDAVRFIQCQPDIASIRLVKFDACSELLQFLSVYYDKVCSMVRKSNACTYCITHKGEDINSGFRHLTSKERSYLRGLLKKSFGGDFRIISKSAGESYPINQILELRNWMIEHALRGESVLPDGVLDLMGELYDNEMCEIAVFQRDEKFDLVSFRVLEREIGHYVFWVVLHKDSQMTTAADIQYMLAKMGGRDCVFDFGTGAYPYKLGTFRPYLKTLYMFETKKPTFKNFLTDVKCILGFYVKPLLRLFRTSR